LRYRDDLVASVAITITTVLLVVLVVLLVVRTITITTVLPVVLVVLLVVRTITITSVLLVVLVVLLVVIVVGADPPGHLVGGLVALLPGLGVTDRPGDLPLDVLGHLVALPLHVLLADGGGSVASGLSLSLAVSVTVSDHVGVMTNNSGAVVDLGVGLAALGGEGVLTLLNIGGVNNSLAHGPGDLALVLLGHLVALPLHMLLALGTGGVSVVTSLGISLSLSLSMMSVSNDLGVMTNNSGAVVNLLGDGVAVLGDDVLALLDVGGVHDGVVLLVADLSLVLDGPLVALLVGLAEALEVVVRGVSVTGLSLGVSLGVSGGVTSDDELGVVTHDSGAVMDLLVMRLTVLGHGVGALLDVGGVHHHVVLLVADLLVVSLAMIVVDHIVDHVALDIVSVLAVTSVGGVSHRGGEGGSGEEKGCAHSEHHSNWPMYFFPPTL